MFEEEAAGRTGREEQGERCSVRETRTKGTFVNLVTWISEGRDGRKDGGGDGIMEPFAMEGSSTEARGPEQRGKDLEGQSVDRFGPNAS